MLASAPKFVVAMQKSSAGGRKDFITGFLRTSTILGLLLVD